jgi:TolB-like protein
MKKLWVLALVVILCTCASGGSSKADAPSAGSTGPADLDSAIQQASKEINDALPQGTKVALLNISSDSDVFSDYVLEEMSIALVKERKLTVVDRREIDLIRGEMNFQMSGDVSDESAQEIGMMLGAQSIISGSIINLGESYRFRTKVINVISAAIQASSSISIGDDPQIRYLLSQGKAPQAAVTQGSARTNPAQAATPAPGQPAVTQEITFPRIGLWKVTGKEGRYIYTNSSLVIEELDGEIFTGYFDWYSIMNSEGREYIRGVYEPQLRKVTIKGYRLASNAKGLGLGTYEAYLARNGYDFVDGIWGGGRGTWEAKWEN